MTTDCRKLKIVPTNDKSAGMENAVHVDYDDGVRLLFYVEKRHALEVVNRYNKYLDLVAGTDNLLCVLEDTCGKELVAFCTDLRQLLVSQGWTEQKLSALLNAREKAGRLKPVTGLQALAAADAHGKRYGGADMFPPEQKPYTVVLRSYSHLNGSDDHTWYCDAATDPTDAENQAIAALKQEDGEPEYTAIAIYEGHLTNLVQ